MLTTRVLTSSLGRENGNDIMRYFTREHDKHSHGLECTRLVYIPVRLTTGYWYLHPGMTSSLSPCSRGGTQFSFWIVKPNPSAMKFSRRSMPLRTLRVKRALGLDYELRMICLSCAVGPLASYMGCCEHWPKNSCNNTSESISGLRAHANSKDGDYLHLQIPGTNCGLVPKL